MARVPTRPDLQNTSTALENFPQLNVLSKSVSTMYSHGDRHYLKNEMTFASSLHSSGAVLSKLLTMSHKWPLEM